ncbi:MAG TPA: serine/threonine protein kinase, partial [Sorangium sp.]|nr:serine/threonine protein kinase [Sorangium sp.]
MANFLIADKTISTDVDLGFPPARTTLPPHSDDFSSGELVAGTAIEHFRVIRLLGRGGMGEVYLARDTKLGRKVAIKLVHEQLLSSRSAIDHFLREARATARFNHPHIVTIYASGQVAGRPFVALEYLEGEDLRSRLLDGPLALGEVLRIGLAIADALAEAHRHGILHRDLKPDNVIIPKDGRLRVVDFGLARVVTQSNQAGATQPTEAPTAVATAVVGTPGYMAPETWLSQPCTGAVDVWSLGALMFELLCGELPYPSKPQALKMMRAAITAPTATRRLSSVMEVPIAIDELIASCLSKSPDNRPTAEQLVATLGALVRGDATTKPERESPFRGLLPFNECHSQYYFGRDDEVASFVEMARTHPVLPVVGPSGAGKTSFALAGVAPRMREQGYGCIVVVRPGATPFRALAARLCSAEPFLDKATTSSVPPSSTRLDTIETLAKRLANTPRVLSQELRSLAERSGTRVLLIVDQLEELFTLNHNVDVQRRFMAALCTAADDWSDPMRVIFAVRDDYLGRIVTSK